MPNNVEFLRAVVADPRFRAGDTSTRFLEGFHFVPHVAEVRHKPGDTHTHTRIRALRHVTSPLELAAALNPPCNGLSSRTECSLPQNAKPCTRPCLCPRPLTRPRSLAPAPPPHPPPPPAPTPQVVAPGMQTSVQDWPGRTRLWHVGVPPSGPMDSLSHRLANALVGNDEDAAALEFSLQGRWEWESGWGRVAERLGKLAIRSYLASFESEGDIGCWGRACVRGELRRAWDAKGT